MEAGEERKKWNRVYEDGNTFRFMHFVSEIN